MGFCLNFCSMVCPDSVCVEEMDLRVIGSVFWWAVEHGWLDRHPFFGLEDFVLIGGKVIISPTFTGWGWKETVKREQTG